MITLPDFQRVYHGGALIEKQFEMYVLLKSAQVAQKVSRCEESKSEE